MSADFWFQQQGGYNPGLIGQSLRFRDDPYLSRAFGTPTNQSRWAISVWLKQAHSGGTGKDGTSEFPFIWAGSYTRCQFTGGNSQLLFDRGTDRGYTQAYFRDPSAWYHIVFHYDGTQGNNLDKATYWVNGVKQSWTNVTGNWGSSLDINGATTHWLGGSNSNLRFGGHMAEYHFFDGNLPAFTEFGEFNAEGVWMPKIVSGLNYGNNGFYLDFSDPNNIGADRSGNGNNFTPNGFELTDTNNPLYDWSPDSPTNNHATWNPLFQLNVDGGESESYSRANAYHDSGRRPPHSVYETIACEPGGQYCFEINYENISGNTNHMPSWNLAYPTADGKLNGTNYRTAASYSGYSGSFFDFDNITGSGGSFQNSGVIGIVWDRTTDRLTQYINGVEGQSGTVRGEFRDMTLFLLPSSAGGSSNYTRASIRSSGFIHNYNTDWELSSSHLPDKLITNPSEHFQTVLDTGANILSSAQSTFPNGLWWIKDRANSNQNQLVDSLVGTGAVTNCPGNNNSAYAAPSGNSVAWCWGTDSSGLNKEAGFEIVRYTGNGGTQNITHRLGAEPHFMMFHGDGTSAPGSTSVYHVGIDSANPERFNMWLDQPAGRNQQANYWDNTRPTSTQFRLGSNGSTNSNGGGYVGWIWTTVPGYSAFGSYVATDNVDNSFIYLGFRPAFFMVKAHSQTSNWCIYDASRHPYNGPNAPNLRPNQTGTEQFFNLDFLSNGVKLRGAGTDTGHANQPYIYAAFAEHPFGGSNVSPSPAR